MKTTVTLLLSCVLLAACGGGGSSAIPNGVDPDDFALVEQILDNCGASGLTSFLALAQDLAGLADPDANLAPFQLTGVEVEQGIINWELDAGGDPLPDFAGSVSFFDPGGASIQPPFDVETVAQDLSNLPTLLAQLENGTRVAIVGAPANPEFALMISMDILFQDGAPVTANATGDLLSLACVATFFFDGLHPTTLADAFPVGEMTMLVQDGDDALQMVLAMAGTSSAVAQVTLNTAATFEVNFDLGTLVVSLP